MDLSISSLRDRPRGDVLILPFWTFGKRPIPAFSSKEWYPYLERLERLGDFLGKAQEMCWVYPENSSKNEEGPCPRLLFLGMGEAEKCKLESLRRTFGAAVKACRKKKLKNVQVLLPSEGLACLEGRAVVRAILEGLFLSNYAFHALFGEAAREERDQPLEKIVLVEEREGSLLVEIERTKIVMHSVDLVRELVSQNADHVTPPYLGSLMRDIARDNPKLSAEILDKPSLEKEKMGLLLAVARGAVHDPILGILEYKGNPSSSEKTVIVGKGITYDTGGLNLKGTGNMETMKCDMAGSAVAIATVQAAAALGLAVNVTAVIAATENAIDAASYKPGDVYVSHAGYTVEISNTDAEGRLVLADAISYVQKHLNPTRIIDLATLTGSIVSALGEDVGGLFSTQDALADLLVKSGERTGESLWRMPIVEDYETLLKSPIADFKNSAGKYAGSITATLFLKKFVKSEMPWAHLDIAGVAYLSEPRYYHTTHATGFGVRLLVDYLSHL